MSKWIHRNTQTPAAGIRILTQTKGGKIDIRVRRRSQALPIFVEYWQPLPKPKFAKEPKL